MSSSHCCYTSSHSVFQMPVAVSILLVLLAPRFIVEAQAATDVDCLLFGLPASAVELLVNSLVRFRYFNNFAAQMTTHEDARILWIYAYVTFHRKTKGLEVEAHAVIQLWTLPVIETDVSVFRQDTAESICVLR